MPETMTADTPETARESDAPEFAFLSAEEALAETVLRAGCKLFSVYPMTPINEVNEEYLKRAPEYDAVSLTCESEMEGGWYAYGASKAGARVMVGSTGVGIALMGEMVSYAARDGVPLVISHWVRGGPGTGPTGSPSQGDYWQAVKAPANGDFRNIVFAPQGVQELVDFTYHAFEVAEQIRGPVTVYTDYSVAKSTEVVALPPRLDPGPREQALTGKRGPRERPAQRAEVRDEGGVSSSSEAVPEEERASRFLYLETATWDRWERYKLVEPMAERYRSEGARLNLVAIGTMARIVRVVVDELRAEGLDVGLIRPQTLFPFPEEALLEAAATSTIMVVELSVGQMAEDVRLALGERPLLYARPGGVVPTLAEVSAQVRGAYTKLGA